MTGKPLADLRTEIDLGMEVYPSTNHDVSVYRLDTGQYVFFRYDPRHGGTPRERALQDEPHYLVQPGQGERVVVQANGYELFETLLADWPHLSAQPVWSTTRIPERLQWKPHPIDG